MAKPLREHFSKIGDLGGTQAVLLAAETPGSAVSFVLVCSFLFEVWQSTP